MSWTSWSSDIENSEQTFTKYHQNWQRKTCHVKQGNSAHKYGVFPLNRIQLKGPQNVDHFNPYRIVTKKDRRRYFNPHLYNRWLTKPNCKNYKLKIKNLSLWINERYRERYRISLSSSNDKLIVFPGLEPNPPVRDVSRVTSLTNQTRVI